ncbi:MAG TPA: PQQ-binding-like beta-propeller repeat protein, partial [Candidatus Kryptonia bacterium]|nr:PQQ-binding-like beta-propeller repeat protein [Candidatus Kryptonia bacterium]
VPGAITGSPLLDAGGPIYFPASDGNLYALTLDGTLKFSVPIGTVSTTFASSPLRTANVVIGTDDGSITALFTNGVLRWRALTNGNVPVASSLGIGVTGAIATTPTPRSTPTAGGSPTPSATPTPIAQVRTLIFAVDAGGTVYALDDPTGEPSGGVSIGSGSATTVSSPAVSTDGCMVFGDDAGFLNVIHLETLYGPNTPAPTPTFTPGVGSQCATQMIHLTDAPIRSSPAIDTGGVVYIGANDGRLYAVGQGLNP